MPKVCGMRHVMPKVHGIDKRAAWENAVCGIGMTNYMMDKPYITKAVDCSLKKLDRSKLGVLALSLNLSRLK